MSKRTSRKKGNQKGAGHAVSGVLPAYNEQEVLRQSVEELHAAMAKACDRFEIIIVDDGSTDDTPRLADELADA